MIYHNVGKYEPTYKILSPEDFSGNVLYTVAVSYPLSVSKYFCLWLRQHSSASA